MFHAVNLLRKTQSGWMKLEKISTGAEIIVQIDARGLERKILDRTLLTEL